MKQLLKTFLLFVLFLVLVVPILGQEVEVTEAPATSPTLEVVEGVEPVVLPPVVAAPEDAADEWLSPELMVIVGAIVLALGLGGAFYVLLKAIDALRFSAPQEVVTMFGNQIIELIHQTREYVNKKVLETDTPVDNALVALADIPLDALEAEIRRRSSPPTIQPPA